MKLVYVSGPYRNGTVSGIVANIRRAEAVAVEVWRAGAACICPHLNTALLDGLCPDNVWLDGDLEMVRRCDAILMVDGWENSVGATAERKRALELSIPVFYNLSEFRDWMENSENESGANSW